MPDESNPAPVDLLREVLENLDSLERLEDHPWVHSRLVQEECARQPSLKERPVGQQLAFAVVQAFREMMPPAPPRQGKRLDTRWGEFGLLAARYFAPFLNGQHYPASLREAWHSLDTAILSFVFDGRVDAGEEERQRYRLAANEPEAAPDSTLSDWHRKGIQRLAEGLERREKYLQNLAGAKNEAKESSTRRLVKLSLLGLVLLLLAGLGLGALKARRAYDLALIVQADAGALKGLASGVDLASLQQAGPALATLHKDFNHLKTEVQPFVPFTRLLGWVPTYGGDLAASGDLLEMADLMLQGGEQSFAALNPLLVAIEAGEPLDPPKAVQMLAEAAPVLEEARARLARAEGLRADVDASRLSPRVRGLLEQYVDPLLPKLTDGLNATLALPGFMGATSTGPKTYLLLAENEDELRPTGGFITAAGNLVVRDGEIQSLIFQDTGLLDEWAMPYPPSPWQLEDYMNSTVLILRDSNWYTDFPVTAETAEYLYSYISHHSVDGVIAFDQHSLVMLLQALGPVKVDGHEGYIDASNVLDYMQQARLERPFGDNPPEGWSYKEFITGLASAVLHKLYETRDRDWETLAKTVFGILNERHILIQVDDPTLAAVLSNNDWDGAVTTHPGDFLMVVDSNVGFNKTSSEIAISLFYDVDLTHPSTPAGSLTVVHENRTPLKEDCRHWDKTPAPGQEKYPIYDCYWNYMRVYMPVGTTLLDYQAQEIPAAWMIQETRVPARVDVLNEDEIDGLQAFGTMMVVPGGKSIQTSLTVSLPPSILGRDPATGGLRYSLTVKKQPGTIAVPITIRVHLPAGARMVSVPQGAVRQENNLLLSTDLRQDLHLELIFSTK